MARALAEQAQRVAARVRDGLGESQGAAGHDEPWLRSGALRNSVGAQADGLQATVGSNDPAAAPQELGTARMPPRPFLALVAAAMGEEVAQAVGAAMAAALRGDDLGISSADANGTDAGLSQGGTDGSNPPSQSSAAPSSAPTPNNGPGTTNGAAHADKSIWQQARDILADPHTALGAASFVPSVPGAVASAADGVLYAAQGKWTDAAIAMGAAAVGMVSDAGAARLAGKGLKAGAEALGATSHAGQVAEVGKAARAAGRVRLEVSAEQAALNQNRFADLAAQQATRGLPVAGSDEDGATLARLDTNGKTYYGANGAAQNPRTSITLERVNAQTKTHAEAEVIQKALNDGTKASGGRAEIWVDRPACDSCGLNGGLRSLARNLGVDELIVHGPEGTYRYIPTK